MPGPDPRKARLMQGPKVGGGKMSPKEKKEKFPFIKTEDGQKIFIMVDEKQKMAKGGRAGLKGGGICKRGMNREAIGKNS